MQQTNGKLNQQAKSIDAVKVELDKVKKCATDAISRLKKSPNTCLEMSGIKPSAECTCEKIVTSIGAVIGVPTVKEDISIDHQIPTYKEDAPPKIIVEFTRRNRFYHNGSLRKLANEKIQDLPFLNLKSTENLYISESLTPYKKQLFSKVNKQKKKLKCKYIWTRSGIIFIKANKNSTTTLSFDTLEDLAKFQNELQHLTA